MNYQDIQKVNSEIKMLDLKGKDYAMVPERVTAFRKLYPDGFITTDIIANDGTTVLMKASVGYYNEDGLPVVLGSGMAQEMFHHRQQFPTLFMEIMQFFQEAKMDIYNCEAKLADLNARYKKLTET